MKKKDIYLTEQSLLELLEGKKILNDDDVIHPPTTDELNIMKSKVDINNADHPSRKKAINILERIATYMGNEDMFDCKETDCGGHISKDNDTRWYDLEDLVTNIIEEKGGRY